MACHGHVSEKSAIPQIRVVSADPATKSQSADLNSYGVVSPHAIVAVDIFQELANERQ